MGRTHGHRLLNGVFISYRRGETSGQARALHDRLVLRFGVDRVFMDVDSIDPGADFVEKIEEAIGSSAVVLVLIGRDWLSRRRGKRLFDDPTDFVRMEAETALRHGVPIVPILIERARMPEPEDLPASLRPITRKSALELENQRWEYDVNRLVQAVEQLIDAANTRQDPALVEEPKETTDEGEQARHHLSRGRLILAGAVALSVAVGVGLILLLSGGQQRVGASAAVTAVTPDRLALELLEQRPSTSEIPSALTAGAPELEAYRATDLVANVLSPLHGPASAAYIDYDIFANSAAARHYYAVSSPLTYGFRRTGSLLLNGVSDPFHCMTGFSSEFMEWDWSCLTLSGPVVSWTVVTDDSDDTSDPRLAEQLTVSAITHLAAVASSTPRGPAPAPPGRNGPGWVFNLLLSPSSLRGFLPIGFQATPELQPFPAAPAAKGLFRGFYVWATLQGEASDYRDFVSYYVFSSNRAAKEFYDEGLNLVGMKPTGTSFAASGFSQPISCATFDSTTTTSAVVAACLTDWGDTAVLTSSWRIPTATTPLDHNEVVAVTLARMAILELAALDTR